MTQSISYKDAGVNIDAANAAKRALSNWRAPLSTNMLCPRLAASAACSVPASTTRAIRCWSRVATRRHETQSRFRHRHSQHHRLRSGRAFAWTTSWCKARVRSFSRLHRHGQVGAEVVAQIVEGLARACSEANCALLGGETAEMPGFYSEGEYDVAASSSASLTARR